MANPPAVSSAAPMMRGLHNAQTKRHLFVALGLTFVCTTMFKYLYCEPRKQAYAEFYKYTNILLFLLLRTFYVMINNILFFVGTMMLRKPSKG